MSLPRSARGSLHHVGFPSADCPVPTYPLALSTFLYTVGPTLREPRWIDPHPSHSDDLQRSVITHTQPIQLTLSPSRRAHKIHQTPSGQTKLNNLHCSRVHTLVLASETTSARA
ncbi:hypothetical protein RSAG8_06687, partial [Rhizoctonia solani AG-8 WAC10335]